MEKEEKTNKILKIVRNIVIIVAVIVLIVLDSFSLNLYLSLSNKVDKINDKVNELTDPVTPSQNMPDKNPSSGDTNKGEVKNIILLIGDGMGFNHLETAKSYFKTESLAMESMSAAKCTTYSLDNLVTDSAAAATALATGYKTANGYVAQRESTVLKSIMRYSAERGKKTGIISTDDPYGATPAAFSSHSSSRNNYDSLLTRQFLSDIDLILGGVWNEDLCTARKDEITGRGYTYVTDAASLNAASDAAKIYGVLPDLHSEYIGDSHIPLKDAATFALNFLADDKDGFTLMIEGARIDKYSHNNDMQGMVDELKDFDETVAACLAWASEREDTAVIVTADHETGGITLGDNGEYAFTTKNHTGQPVPLFAYNVSFEKKLYDNTGVFDMCFSLVVHGAF